MSQTLLSLVLFNRSGVKDRMYKSQLAILPDLIIWPYHRERMQASAF